MLKPKHKASVNRAKLQDQPPAMMHSLFNCTTQALDLFPCEKLLRCNARIFIKWGIKLYFACLKSLILVKLNHFEVLLCYFNQLYSGVRNPGQGGNHRAYSLNDSGFTH